MKDERTPPPATPARAQDDSGAADALPPYEPPRVVKKRSVARATLATGTGPVMGGLMAQG